MSEGPVRILVVVFTPEGGADPSAAYRAMKEVASSWDPGEEGPRLEILEVPRAYRRSAESLHGRLQGDPPEILLVYDTDAGSDEYKLHQFAANYDDAARPDVDGEMRQDHIIDPDGPVAFRTRLPLDGIWDKFLVERVPVRMSHKADHVFNHLLYRILQTIHDEGIPTLAGAVETPPLEGTGAGDASATTGRSHEELVEETRMVLAVLHTLYPARDPASSGPRSG